MLARRLDILTDIFMVFSVSRKNNRREDKTASSYIICNSVLIIMLSFLIQCYATYAVDTETLNKPREDNMFSVQNACA
jgi:hypothetical protein